MKELTEEDKLLLLKEIERDLVNYDVRKFKTKFLKEKIKGVLRMWEEKNSG